MSKPFTKGMEEGKHRGYLHGWQKLPLGKKGSRKEATTRPEAVAEGCLQLLGLPVEETATVNPAGRKPGNFTFLWYSDLCQCHLLAKRSWKPEGKDNTGQLPLAQGGVENDGCRYGETSGNYLASLSIYVARQNNCFHF